jgi:hypothetical protein
MRLVESFKKARVYISSRCCVAGFDRVSAYKLSSFDRGFDTQPILATLMRRVVIHDAIN